MASLLLLGGCTLTSAEQAKTAPYGEPTRSQHGRQREKDLQTTWRGRPYYALLDTFGTPKLIMNVPGYRPLKTSVVVYGIRDETSHCIDAFTVVHGRSEELTISDYFCR